MPPPPPPPPARPQAPLLPRLQPYAEALAPAALAALIALLLRGCALPSWVRLPAAPSIISAAAIALQQEGGGGGATGAEWLTEAPGPSGSSASGLRAPFLPPHVCSAAARALFAVPGAAAPVPLLALLFLWHLGASYLQPSSAAKEGGGGGGALAQLPRLAAGARIAWNVTRDLGVMLVVLGAIACWEQAWEGGRAAAQ